jgi:hypothetical protein
MTFNVQVICVIVVVGCVVAQAFGFPFIEPILLENVPGFPINFTHGVNFAYAGATAEPNTTFTPVYLELELEQFFAYKAALSNSSRKEKNNYTLKYSTYTNKLASLKH